MNKKRTICISSFIALLAVAMIFIFADTAKVLASTDLNVTSNKTLTSKFNNYDNVTVAAGVTLTLADRAGEPVGLEIKNSLVVEKGAKITGNGLLIFDSNATYSGITLYYKYNNNYCAIPAGLSLSTLSMGNSDYKPSFKYLSSKGIYVLEAEFNGGDPFELSLNTRNAVILKKETLQMSLSGITEGVTWTSSNPSIASISSNGKVKGKKVGRVTITATYADKEYTADIEVANKGLNAKTLYMEPGTKFFLQLNGTTVKSVSSSNKKVAKISKKLVVTAVGEGTCTLTVKGKDGKKYKCKLEVRSGNDQPLTPADEQLPQPPADSTLPVEPEPIEESPMQEIPAGDNK